MKNKVPFLFFFLFSIHSFMHAQLSIHMEDAYTFQRIQNSYVLIETATKKKVYQANKDGVIQLDKVNEAVKVTFYAPNYQTIQSHFDANTKVNIKAILEPQQGYTQPETQEGTLYQGFIYDEFTGKPLQNALVFFPEFALEKKVNGNGFFSIHKNEIANYTAFTEGDSLSFIIRADKYQEHQESFRFTTATTYTGVGLNLLEKPIIANAQPANIAIATITESLAACQARTMSYTCDNLPSSIRVGTGCSCNTCTTVSVMGIEVYTRKGLNDEWIASWEAASLKAGSLPYKSYGAYHVSHPIAANYDISNTTCRQVWDSDYASSCISACSITSGKYMVTTTNAIAFTEYSAENNGLNAPAGESCGDGFAGNSTSAPCIADNLCAGHDRYGHGRGMCQWGTQRWALNGKTYQWIADHYYNPVNIYRCDDGSGTSTALDCSNAISLTCNTSYHGASSTAASNVGQYACNTWTETGPERVHTWTATGDGSFTVSLSNFTGDLDIYILDSCDPSDCIGTVASSSATYANAVSGQTYYIVVDADDGSGSAYDIIVNCSALPVLENELSAIQIVPNPSEGIFTINTNTIEVKQADLYNALGQYIKTVDTHQIDLTDFAAGFYYLKIQTADKREKTFKLIKK